MDLFIIRHADAVPLGGEIKTDADRPLTALGLQQSRLLAASLHEHKVHFATMLTSPLVRARQTAEEIASHWPGPMPEVKLCDFLAPGGKKRKLARALSEIGHDRMAVVGHQPDLGELVGWLIGGRRANIDLSKAGVVLVHCPVTPEKCGGQLEWMLTPSWLVGSSCS